MSENQLYNLAFWEMGSWNAGDTGFNLIDIQTTSDRQIIFVSHWVYVYGKGYFGDILWDLIPIAIELIISIR